MPSPVGEHLDTNLNARISIWSKARFVNESDRNKQKERVTVNHLEATGSLSNIPQRVRRRQEALDIIIRQLFDQFAIFFPPLLIKTTTFSARSMQSSFKDTQRLQIM